MAGQIDSDFELQDDEIFEQIENVRDEFERMNSNPDHTNNNTNINLDHESSKMNGDNEDNGENEEDSKIAEPLATQEYQEPGADE